VPIAIDNRIVPTNDAAPKPSTSENRSSLH
jgi:hypothetical protein